MSRTLFSGQRIPRELVILPSHEYYRRRYRSDSARGWWLFVVTVVAVLVAAAGARADAMPAASEADASAGTAQAHLGEVGLNAVSSGDLMLVGQSQGRYQPAIHLNSRASIRVRGLLAEVTLEQEFKNVSDAWREAVYVLPLPDRAAVSGLEIQIGERRIVGKVRERQKAAEIYRAAKAAGKRAALLEQQRPNLFTNKVANIGPGEQVKVQVRFLQPLTFDAGIFSLRLPTTLTPRYIPGQPRAVSDADDGTEATITVGGSGWALPTDQVPDADRVSPYMAAASELAGQGSHRISVDVDLDSGLPLADIAAPYHDIETRRVAVGHHQIALRGHTALMDRDFVLRWRPRASTLPQAALFARSFDAPAEGGYLQLLLLPPQVTHSSPRLPREVVFVIDTSGSMGGNSIRQAKESLLLALGRLQPHDRFNVIEFNSMHRSVFPRPVAADPANIAVARAAVEGLQASGGTEMAPALRSALSQQLPGDDTVVRQVVFITDGAVGNESALFELIRQAIGRARLFTVGIGSAPNGHFMRKAAQYGRGSWVTVGDVNEVQAQMEMLFQKLERPLVTDLQVQWPQGIRVEAFPRRLPDLYQGEPLQLVAKLEGALAGDVLIRGRLAGQQFQRRMALSGGVDLGAGMDGGIGALWARAKIESLRDGQREVGESSREGQALRSQILQLALDHQIVSPYTSFVAVEEVIARPQAENLKRSAVVNAVARGQVLQRQAYPQTATGVFTQLLVGFGLLGAAVALHGRRLIARIRCRLLRILRALIPNPHGSGRRERR